MDFWTIIFNSVTTLISVGLMIISVYNINVVNKERSKTYRDMLYAKQLDSYPKVISAIRNIVGKAIMFYLAPDDKESWERRKNELATSLDELKLIGGESNVYLSDNMTKHLQDFHVSLNTLAVQKAKNPSFIPAVSEIDEIGAYLTKAITIAREDLLVSPLSKATLEVIQKTI